MNARRIPAAPDIMVGMRIIGLLCLAFDRLLRAIERRLYAR
jgi:ABC-type nitrate/sulfonate/bicarbonate transport system permease component